MTDDPPRPTPEGQLIRRARSLSIPKLTIPSAARRIGMSAEQWGYIERGYYPARGGNRPRPFSPPAATLAKMAYSLQITPERLESEGQRPDAADILREILRQAEPEPARSFPLPEPTPEMKRDLEPLLAEVSACARVARAAYPGQLLTGEQVFPDSPDAPAHWRAARAYWDVAAAEGFRQEYLPDVVATLLAWKTQLDRRHQNESAAG